MPSSRRRVLASLGTAAAVGLAGCSGGDSSSSPDCSISNADHGDAEVLHGVTATVEDGDVRFVVTFLDDAEMTDLDLVSVADAAGRLMFTIPVVAGDGPMGTRRRYEQSLGSRPKHGRYLVVVADDAGEVVDEVTADVNCVAASTSD